MKPLFLILLALPLCGCPAIDVLEGKESPSKAAHERRMALVSTPVVASAAPVKVAEVKPEPPEPPPLPPCTVTFRVNRCGPNNEVLPW